MIKGRKGKQGKQKDVEKKEGYRPRGAVKARSAKCRLKWTVSSDFVLRKDFLQVMKHHINETRM